MLRLTFLGAAGTVTGSKYLLDCDGKKILIDCGLFQGLKELRLLNWEPPAFPPQDIESILLTHGHMDHTGYIPRLVRLGFRGKIYGTALTLKIAEIILKDSAKIQEEEAERANREKYSKHAPALPLYTLEDVEKTLPLFTPIPEGELLKVNGTYSARFLYNGHILGSTFIELEADGKKMVFSGDLGREEDLLLYPPKKPDAAEILLIETTYGGRLHKEERDELPELSRIVNQTVNRGGSLFIPSFAVERTQLLMVMLWKLSKAKQIPSLPMIMDSPMGADVLDLFEHSHKWHRLTSEECKEVCSYFRVVSSYRETMEYRERKESQIVIAGSGMLTGGRMLSYLETHASNEKDTLLFVGYQAEGTRGWRILKGEPSIKMYGKWVPFKMQVQQIEGLSSHADQKGLLDWMDRLNGAPKPLFLIHGEKEQSLAFKQKLEEEKGWASVIPSLNQTVTL